jgi:hypothetical protein
LRRYRNPALWPALISNPHIRVSSPAVSDDGRSMGSSNADEQTLLTFFGNAIPMLAKHPLVERYAWYPWDDFNHLDLEDANEVRTITALGKAFAAPPADRP